MMDTDALEAIVLPLIDQTEPGEQIEVLASSASSLEILAYDGEIEKFTSADEAALGVRVVRDGRVGFASSGSLDAEIAADVLAEARDNLPFSEPDPFVFIAATDGVEPVLEYGCNWSDGVAAMDLDDKIALAIELERRTRDGDPRISGVRNAGYGDEQRRSLFMTSTGLRSDGISAMSSIAVSAMATDDGQTQTGGAFDATRDPAELDIDRVVSDAVMRTTRMLGAVQPKSAKLTVVFEPQHAASLIGIIGGMFSGDRVLKGRTPFAGRIGESIADPRVHLVDDPTNPASFGARIYDSEGLAVRPNALIDGGVLGGFLYHSNSAARAGEAGTASARRGVRSTPAVGWHALQLAPDHGTLAELIADVDDGLLVHSMSGLHSGVNAVSGDFSVGVEGIAIRNGELAEPIREATLASTLPRMLTDIERIGGDVEHRTSRVSTPPLSVAGLSLSGA